MIPTTGFCFHLIRKREEIRATKAIARTVGTYQCYWNAEAVHGLSGQVVECHGPGDNTYALGNKDDRRIEAGIYPLAVQDGKKFKTIGYSPSDHHTALPRPGILLKETNERIGILIHPAMDYLWSVGCLNLTSGLADADSKIDYKDSRARVIAIIDFIKGKLTVPGSGASQIYKAVVIIEGEPN